MNIKRKIIFGLILLLSLQTAEAGAIAHALDKACASVSEQVPNVAADSVQNSIDKIIFEDDCCDSHSHTALALGSADLVFHPISIAYISKLPIKYVVNIATPLRPPRTI